MDASSATHVFEVTNYSLHHDLGVGIFLRSSIFHAGGCAWSVLFYPGGCGETSSTATHVAVALELMTTDAVVTASYDMSLVDEATGAGYSAVKSDVVELDTRCVQGFARTWCIHEFMDRSKLEPSPFLRSDRLVIECTLRVITATRAAERPPKPVVAELTLPPSSLHEDMSRLLEDGQGADVTFLVNGESFRAHKNVLAVRAPPALQAIMLSGQQKDGPMTHVPIHILMPEVFKGLLHFIYADFLKGMDDLSKERQVVMARELLAAAKLFDMERLKLVCGHILSKNLEVENVAVTLVLADRHNCAGLKCACIEFMISNRMDDVARSKEYNVLKAHPHLLVEALEKAGKLGRI